MCRRLLTYNAYELFIALRGWTPTGHLYAGGQIYTNAICEQVGTLLLHNYLLRLVQDALINMVFIKTRIGIIHVQLMTVLRLATQHGN